MSDIPGTILRFAVKQRRTYRGSIIDWRQRKYVAWFKTKEEAEDFIKQHPLTKVFEQHKDYNSRAFTWERIYLYWTGSEWHRVYGQVFKPGELEMPDNLDAMLEIMGQQKSRLVRDSGNNDLPTITVYR